MWSAIIIILIIVIFLISLLKIYLDVKRKKSKSYITGEGIILLLVIGVLIIADVTLVKEKKIEEKSEEKLESQPPPKTESDRVTKILAQLQDYMGELSRTDKPQVQLFLRQGLEHKINGEHSQALESFRQALDLNLTDGERLAFFILMGNSEAFLKEYSSAINYYYQAERIGKDTDNDTFLAVVYSNLALASQLADDLTGALDSYFNLLERFKHMGDKSGEKNTLANLGFVYQMRGNTDSAEVYHKKSLESSGAETDFLTQAAQMNNLALTYRLKGRLDSALVLHEQSLLLFRKAGDKKDEASVLGNMGLIYQDLGNLEKALEYHRQALESDSIIGDLMGQASDLTNIGSVWEQKKDFAKALEFYTRALSFFERIGAKREIEFVRGNIQRVKSNK